jgi:hypothetical protein
MKRTWGGGGGDTHLLMFLISSGENTVYVHKKCVFCEKWGKNVTKSYTNDYMYMYFVHI